MLRVIRWLAALSIARRMHAAVGSQLRRSTSTPLAGCEYSGFPSYGFGRLPRFDPVGLGDASEPGPGAYEVSTPVGPA